MRTTNWQNPIKWNKQLQEQMEIPPSAEAEAKVFAMIQESKADKFIRIIDGRMEKAITALDNVENVFNTNNYSFTQEQARRVFVALRRRISELEQYATKGTKARKTFSIMDDI